MNRSKETHITDINSSFYKNVFLLTQVLSPSFEFKQHFKKDMFNKPNTAAFLHVSHYLSVIYDANLFKQMVRWPILCKNDIVTYRIEIKNFFSILSKNNPDANFQPIMMSHLILSRGMKFLIVMWKLSQLALRAYIKREFQGKLLGIPYTSPMDDLTIIYFNNVIVEKYSIVIEVQKETKNILDATRNFLNSEIEILNVYKLEIFKKKMNIKRLASNVPAHPLFQDRLIDVEDSNIINLWKSNILEKLQYIRNEKKELNTLEDSCNRLYKLILRINSKSEILDANEFPKISCDNHLIKHLIHDKHTDDSIRLSTLLSMLYLTSTQMTHRIIVANYLDLSQCLSYIQNAYERIKLLQTLFIAINTKVNNIFIKEQGASKKIENIYINFDTDSIRIANCDMFLKSPKINFNFSQCLDDNLFYETLCSSPEDKYKHLFKRYKCKSPYPSYKLSVASSGFSNSWNDISGRLSPRAHSTKYEQVLCNEKSLSPLYSRLLYHTKLRTKRFRDNALCSPSVSYEGLNLTPKRHCSKRLRMDGYNERERNLFDSA